MNGKSLKPVPKVAAAGIGGAATGVVVVIANALGLDLPPEAAATIVWLGSLGAGYLKRDKRAVAA